ncbi:OLC1v1023904C1 [Oldenlandia corymbosa var. corymbosa]|uniref:OLC1v1023904C1 n=1 Tax=Oldenlandia corymbosa var. corymbosa TaxID=529605 RepID=A0AAV1C4K1_OLDCO|nr:OLC1v1023904C1 [Oldenlandia corymbosa var. corymbosa]
MRVLRSYLSKVQQVHSNQKNKEMELENGNVIASYKWAFRGNELFAKASSVTVRGVLDMLMGYLDPNDPRPTIPLGHGDPSAFPSFRTSSEAVNASHDALSSSKLWAIAEHLSHDLPYKLSPDDVYVTCGCGHAVEVILHVVARPNANILLPRPGYPYYQARSAFCHMEPRFFDLLPEQDWEVDLESVESMADENTVAMIAETARKLGILVISDEVYYHLVFGDNPFVPMGVFGSIVPVVTVGSISKRLLILVGFLNMSADPSTIIQGAIGQILEETKGDFLLKINNLLREAADSFCSKIKEIPCITCPSKPQGSMSAMVRLNLSHLENIVDDMDFCLKLAKEKSVIVLPGVKNWLRISFVVEPTILEDGLNRLKTFCERHAMKSQGI